MPTSIQKLIDTVHDEHDLALKKTIEKCGWASISFSGKLEGVQDSACITVMQILGKLSWVTHYFISMVYILYTLINIALKQWVHNNACKWNNITESCDESIPIFCSASIEQISFRMYYV